VESKFTLKSNYTLSGDQERAVDSLTSYLEKKHKWQTLWGVTGSGKTFTMAHVIEKLQKPALVIAHNKTLAAQLATEFKEFFPDAAVHYFVSYYDYYQPEAYVQKTDTYIEKEATINEEIDRLRHAATQSLLRRKDVIIVASVSCIYGIGDIDAYTEQTFFIEVGKSYVIEELIKQLVNIQFTRAGADFKPGNFLVMGDVLEIWLASMEQVYTIEFWGNEVSAITLRDYLSGHIYEKLETVEIFPAKHTVTSKDTINAVIPQIQAELEERLAYFSENGDVLKHERLKAKVEYDIEMMQEVGYVNGIENYSRYLDGRNAGDPAATLIDYFWDDFLAIIDESHMTIPQIGGMYAGDRSRKENLVNNGFRLPSAMDNRPLRFEEFEKKLRQVVAVSATPSTYEIHASSNIPQKFFWFDPTVWESWTPTVENRIVPQVIRPTGLLDPIIRVQPMEFMVDAIMHSISQVQEKNERMLITTLTKRSSEELTDYLVENGVKVQYLHSEVETLERIEILKDLRTGKIDVIVGVNLLREGLDLPEVSKIAILDADKQWFLRSTSALIQIIGRAARNSSGTVTMYTEQISQNRYDALLGAAEKVFMIGESGPELLHRLDAGKLVNAERLIVSESMKKAIDLNYYRRKIQTQYNEIHSITPTTILSSIKDIWLPSKKKKTDATMMSTQEREKQLKRLELEMDIASANLEFEKAADLRDQIIDLKKSKRKR
jgi:excinuclease ABC subunit B